LPAFLRHTRKGYAGPVRRDMRRQRNGAQVGELFLVRAIVIHLPDLFRPAAVTDEVDLGFGDSGDSATQAKDDFVGKTMCYQTSVGAICFLVVLLSKHLWRLHILG